VKKSDRHRLILDVLDRSGRLRITDVARESGMTEMTIRRDLETLEQMGALSRVHGGAVSAVSQSHSPHYQSRALANVEAKERIGVATAGLLAEGETLIMDAGSTTAAVARALLGRRNLRIMTMDLRIAAVLADDPGLTVMVTGGTVRAAEHGLFGTGAERAFVDYNFDTYVMSASGVDAIAGVTEFNADDAAVKRAALGSVRRTILVADSAKLDVVTYANVCGLEDVDVLVTDEAGADSEAVSALRAGGTRIVSA
jgi:DeoR/GlpR family transcriptional regulator of sugar metabolism